MAHERSPLLPKDSEILQNGHSGGEVQADNLSDVSGGSDNVPQNPNTEEPLTKPRIALAPIVRFIFLGGNSL